MNNILNIILKEIQKSGTILLQVGCYSLCDDSETQKDEDGFSIKSLELLQNILGGYNDNTTIVPILLFDDKNNHTKELKSKKANEMENIYKEFLGNTKRSFLKDSNEKIKNIISEKLNEEYVAISEKQMANKYETERRKNNDEAKYYKDFFNVPGSNSCSRSLFHIFLTLYKERKNFGQGPYSIINVIPHSCRDYSIATSRAIKKIAKENISIITIGFHYNSTTNKTENIQYDYGDLANT